MSGMPDTYTEVDAHEFKPLGLLDRFRSNGRCQRCFVPRADHPTFGYVRARWLGNKQPAYQQKQRVA